LQVFVQLHLVPQNPKTPSGLIQIYGAPVRGQDSHSTARRASLLVAREAGNSSHSAHLVQRQPEQCAVQWDSGLAQALDARRNSQYFKNNGDKTSHVQVTTDESRKVPQIKDTGNSQNDSSVVNSSSSSIMIKEFTPQHD